jgi:hypothetical protein
VTAAATTPDAGKIAAPVPPKKGAPVRNPGAH